MLGDPYYMLNQPTEFRASDAFLKSREREWLTGEASTQDIMRRHRIDIYFRYVALRLKAVVGFIQISKLRVNFGCKNTCEPASFGKTMMESPKASEKINELEISSHQAISED